LPTGALLPPDQNLRVTMTAGCEYHPDAKCPTFDRVLLQIFNDDVEMAEYFMTLLGYALSGRPVLSLMVILHGLGANGKSTLMTIMRKVFGQYAKTADATTFITEPGKGGGNAGGPREDLLRLRGARLVIVNEPDEGGELREGAIKAMTGGDTITARGINAKNSVEIDPTWTIVMPTNHKPLVRGTDHGIWRRIVLVPFERNFETDKTVQIDRNLGDKLDKELPGVLARVVRAYLSYKNRGVSHPERVRLAKEQYRNQMDLLAEWIGECCEVGESYEQQTSDLWESWQIFASKNGVLNYVRSNIALARRLDAKFPGVRQSHGLRYRQGIRLKQQVPF
jgi:P4 family phage/plasmid primase-like protien